MEKGDIDRRGSMRRTVGRPILLVLLQICLFGFVLLYADFLFLSLSPPPPLLKSAGNPRDRMTVSAGNVALVGFTGEDISNLLASSASTE